MNKLFIKDSLTEASLLSVVKDGCWASWIGGYHKGSSPPGRRSLNHPPLKTPSRWYRSLNEVGGARQYGGGWKRKTEAGRNRQSFCWGAAPPPQPARDKLHPDLQLYQDRPLSPKQTLTLLGNLHTLSDPLRPCSTPFLSLKGITEDDNNPILPITVQTV